MKKIVSLLLGLILICCISREDNYLNKGLTELKNHKIVNEEFIQGFEIQKFGIIKSENEMDSYKLVFLLNNNADHKLVEKYRMGIRCHLDPNNTKLNNNKFIKFFDFSPVVEIHNNHKYIINEINTSIEKIDSINFYLYDRENYLGRTYGKKITIRNIKIKKQ